MGVTLFLLSIILCFALVVGQETGPVAPGDFQIACHTDHRYRTAHDWIPYVNATSVGVRGEVKWQILVDQYDYQNIIGAGQIPPSPWERRDIDGDGLQFITTGGGTCLYSIGVRSTSYQNSNADNWVFTQSVNYLEALEVIVNASVAFRGCQQRSELNPPCRNNFVTLHRYDTNSPTTVSQRTDPTTYQPYLGGDAVGSRLEPNNVEATGDIIMTYRRPKNFKFTHFGIQDTGTYGSVNRLLVYYKVAQGYEDGLVVCPSIALPPAGSGETNTKLCTCKANATGTASLMRRCDENGVCQQHPLSSACQCSAGYQFSETLKSCQGCPMGTYKTSVSSTAACIPCPDNSMTINASATLCDCIRGTVRCPSKPDDRCQEFDEFFARGADQCQVSAQDPVVSNVNREGAIAITFFVTLILTAVITALVVFIVLYILWKKL